MQSFTTPLLQFSKDGRPLYDRRFKVPTSTGSVTKARPFVPLASFGARGTSKSFLDSSR